jgi:AbrB family looped-hinge helix DNA binding protein
VEVNPPHGPFKIGANRQITIPAELLKRIDLTPGDSVYVAMADDVEGSLIVVPVERLVSWIDAGRRSASGEAETAVPRDESRRPGRRS